jgi:hypothetical protein
MRVTEQKAECIMIINPRFIIVLATFVAFAIASVVPPASAAELPVVSSPKAVRIAPALKKPAAPIRVRVAWWRSDLLPSGGRGYALLGVGFGF